MFRRHNLFSEGAMPRMTKQLRYFNSLFSRPDRFFEWSRFLVTEKMPSAPIRSLLLILMVFWLFLKLEIIGERGYQFSLLHFTYFRKKTKTTTTNDESPPSAPAY